MRGRQAVSGSCGLLSYTQKAHCLVMSPLYNRVWFRSWWKRLRLYYCCCCYHLKVFDGWILKGEKFPSSQDHPLPTMKRYTDFCESGLTRRSITSSQNVAMIFFRVHEPGNGFTLTIKTDPNRFRKSTRATDWTRVGRWSVVTSAL